MKQWLAIPNSIHKAATIRHLPAPTDGEALSAALICIVFEGIVELVGGSRHSFENEQINYIIN